MYNKCKDSDTSVPTYKNTIFYSTIDHIFANDSLISRVTEFFVRQDPP